MPRRAVGVQRRPQRRAIGQGRFPTRGARIVVVRNEAAEGVHARQVVLWKGHAFGEVIGGIEVGSVMGGAGSAVQEFCSKKILRSNQFYLVYLTNLLSMHHEKKCYTRLD